MRTKRPSASTTFYKFDKVNGRSYKTIRAQARVGPTPDVMHTIATPKSADQRRRQAMTPDFDHQEPDKEHKLDSYNETNIDEGLDSDGLSSWEAGFMRGSVS